MRNFRIAGLVAFVQLALCAFIVPMLPKPAKAGAGPDPVVTSRLTIVDDAGKERMILGMVSGCPSINLFTRDGTRSVQLYVMDDKPEFIFFSEDGQKNKFRIFMDKDNVPHIVQFDNTGMARLDINVDKTGNPGIDLADKRGTVLKRLGK